MYATAELLPREFIMFIGLLWHMRIGNCAKQYSSLSKSQNIGKLHYARQ
jgi:hypothetical protein